MNKDKTFNGVQDTLYIPLAARIYATEKFPQFFYDEKALSLKNDILIKNIENNTTEYFYMASVCRQKTIDKLIKKFIEQNKSCNVVFLGSGLETSYNRINNITANFYQIDLSSVIKLRSKLLKNGNNEKLISGDMFTLNWVKEIDTNIPTIIIVAGVYQYFYKEKIIDMIKKMKSLIPKGELIFDVTNSKGLKMANRYVRKTGNINAKMNFSLDDPYSFAITTGTRIQGIYGFFDEALKKCKGLKIKTRIYMYFADKLNRTMIIHLKFK